jgi:hypothetical protein
LAQQTNATLSLTDLSLDQAGSYTAVVTNNIGSVTSTPALLAVGFTPTIINSPTNQVAAEGDTVSFDVAAQGTGPLTYQWYFDDASAIQGATGPTLVLFNVAPGQSGDYSVVVANSFGSVTSAPVSLVVGGPPLIMLNPHDQVATNGGTTVFSVVAQGTASLAYQWYFEETNSLLEATNATLVLTNVAPAQAGSYSVVVTNGFGAVTSTAARLDILLPITPSSLAVSNGADVVFSASVQGTSTLSYQWFFNLTNSIPGATNTTLALSNVTPANLGTYSIAASNAAASVARQDASLRVLVAPQILSITSTNGAVTLTFSTVANLYYEVFYKTNVLDPVWLGLPKKTDVLLRLLGTGSPMSIQDAIGSQQRYYTVIAE